MKITKFTRIVVPLSTGCALMLALSACMTVERSNPGKSEGASPISSISSSASSSASPESSTASPTTNPTEEKQKNEEQSHEKQIVGLTDDNKAGKPRPRAEQKSQSSLGKNVKLKDDGSWTVEEGSGQDKLSVVVNVDGTFHVKRGTGSDIYHEMTINADGSWERIEKFLLHRQKLALMLTARGVSSVRAIHLPQKTLRHMPMAHGSLADTRIIRSSREP